MCFMKTMQVDTINNVKKNSTLQLLRDITFIPAHISQELHDDDGIFSSLGTTSQTAKKYFLTYQLP